MLERKFIFEENQKIWDAYYIQNLQVWNLENKEKLENLQWTEEEKIIQGKRLIGYNMPLDKVTPYNCGYIRKKQNTQQYKPVVLRFEKYIKKSFNESTGIELEQFREIEKKINHLNAFLIYCINNDIIQNNNRDFLIALLPKFYKKIGRKISTAV